jgi:hypothetical protein
MKKVKLNIITPTRNIRREVAAPVGQDLTDEDIQKVLQSAKDAAEKSFPTLHFRTVKMADGSFNLVGEYPEKVAV